MRLRFGLLGTGYWAEQTHGAGLVAHASAELVGVWGRDPAKTDALARRLHCRPYRDADALIGDVDAVAVALPPDVQAELATRAAEAGRHLLLDKPLAFDVPAADRLLDAVNRHRAASVVFFTSRFFPEIEEFLAAAVRRGGWHGARAVRFSSITEPGNPYAESVWRREKGGLWDVGPHALSVLMPVLGPVTEVSAMDGPRSTTHVLLRHAGAAVSTLALTVDAPAAAVGSDMVFFGESGTVALPDTDGTALDAFGRAVDELVSAVSGGSGVACDVRFGRDVVAILAAAEQAVRTGRAQRP